MSLQEVESKMDHGYGACAETQLQVCNHDAIKKPPFTECSVLAKHGAVDATHLLFTATP